MSGSNDTQIAEEMPGDLAKETVAQTGVFDVYSLPVAGLEDEEGVLFRFEANPHPSML